MNRNNFLSLIETAKDAAIGIVSLLGITIGFGTLVGICIGSLYWSCMVIVSLLSKLIGG